MGGGVLLHPILCNLPLFRMDIPTPPPPPLRGSTRMVIQPDTQVPHVFCHCHLFAAFVELTFSTDAVLYFHGILTRLALDLYQICIAVALDQH